MLWTDFLAQVRREFSEPTSSVISDTDLLAWANEATLDIARRTLCLSDEVYATSIVGQRSYAVDDYTVSPRNVFYGDDELLRESYEDWHDESEDLTDTGTPVAYTVVSNVLYLRPAPDEEQTIRMFRYRWPDPMTAASSLPFADKYNRLIADYMKAKVYGQLETWDAADRFNAFYEQGVERAAWQETNENATDTYIEPRTDW